MFKIVQRCEVVVSWHSVHSSNANFKKPPSEILGGVDGGDQGRGANVSVVISVAADAIRHEGSFIIDARVSSKSWIVVAVVLEVHVREAQKQGQDSRGERSSTRIWWFTVGDEVTKRYASGQ